ncbi:MAG: MoaD/ThiS family protein [Planctomycetes bacterium]|nr:MoaD/ThiS family protein [Planctomycetota bacterium]
MKIRMFGYLKEKSNKTFIDIRINQNISIKQLAEMLSKDYGIDISSVRFAVKDEFVSGSYKVNNNSVIDLIPPVAGG